jgi:Flp pilus assembly protein TadD
MQRGHELLQAHPDKALAEFEAAEELGSRGAKLGKAMAHEALGQYLDAEKILLDAVAGSPDDLDLALALVRVRIALGKLDEARTELQKTLRRTPPHVPSMLLFASLAKTTEQGAAGRAALTALTDQRYSTFRNSAEYAVAESSLLIASGDAQSARQRLEKASTSRSTSPQLAVAVSDSLKLVGRLREAEWLLERAASDAAAPEVVHERLAAVAMDLRHLSLAEQALGKLRTGFKPDPRALLLQARLFELKNDKEGSASASGRALDALPSDVDASERRRIQLAHVDALIRAGKQQDAQAILQRMLGDEPKFSPARAILAALLLADGKGTEALELVTPLLGEPALFQQTYPILVAAKRQAGKMDEAESTAREFHQKTSGSPRAAALLAEVLEAQGKSGEALSVIDAARKTHADESQLIAAKLELTEKAQGLEAAIKVAEAMAAADKSPAGSLRVAALYTKHSRNADAAKVLDTLTQRFPRDTRTWAELAAARARLGRTADAAAALEHVVGLVPFDTGALTALGTLYKKLGRLEDAQQAYEKVLQVEPSSLVPLNNLAVLLSEREGQAKRAVELARQARAIASKDAAIADTLGWALANTEDPKDLEEAVTLLHSSSKQLRVPEGYYHYGVALMRAGKRDEALAELRRALQKADGTPWAEQAKKAVAELEQAK